MRSCFYWKFSREELVAGEIRCSSLVCLPVCLVDGRLNNNASLLAWVRQYQRATSLFDTRPHGSVPEEVEGEH